VRPSLHGVLRDRVALLLVVLVLGLGIPRAVMAQVPPLSGE
jgi:hypothetical protein